jgi:hypothetical protein
MKTFMTKDDWTSRKTPKALLNNAGTGSTTAATDQQYTDLQDAFDSVSRLTLATKRLGAEIVAAVGGKRSADTASRGITLCKGLVGPIAAIENLLMSDRKDL